MPIDYKKLQEQAQRELAESKKQNEGESGSKYPTVYVGQDGKLTVKLFYNLKMGGVQRKILRHSTSDPKVKVPCMSYYGETCPICEAIKNAESVHGKEIGAFTKYGYKMRGICYAQIIDHDPSYLKEQTDPKNRDVVLLMYPKTIYEKINQTIVNAGNNLDKLIGSNDGLPIVLERTKNGKSYEYNVSVYPFGGQKSFETDEEFDKVVNELPDLEELYMPEFPTDEVRQKVKAIADSINAEYIGSNVVNPTSTEVKPVTPMPNTVTEDVPFAMGESTSDFPDLTETVETKPTATEGAKNPSGKACFGKHNDTSEECMKCPFECDCVMSAT